MEDYVEEEENRNVLNELDEYEEEDEEEEEYDGDATWEAIRDKDEIIHKSTREIGTSGVEASSAGSNRRCRKLEAQ